MFSEVYSGTKRKENFSGCGIDLVQNKVSFTSEGSKRRNIFPSFHCVKTSFPNKPRLNKYDVPYGAKQSSVAALSVLET
jgi:hypothetical protein